MTGFGRRLAALFFVAPLVEGVPVGTSRRPPVTSLPSARSVGAVRSRSVVVLGPPEAVGCVRALTRTLARSKGTVVVGLLGCRDAAADAVLLDAGLVVIAIPRGGPAGLAAAVGVGLGAVPMCSVTFDPRAGLLPWRHRGVIASVSRSLLEP